ncbi:hypothetical protein IOK49_00205 [Fervidicoccus fontis]|uniref:Rubredoxin n=1 Tax=Fervidicoccus fontis TaxID=683846 RepID=A0A2J6N3G8_9CREN|nr:hypothetical protein [Fervidicoccus fontis]MBE9390512.1 hypothetical protein [Fervidicoccus fontis]PMB75859.1 MAG: hypothetical protein C0188_01375 [Fervidicoccus fontis]PMB77738.1 MAG: hypothetical protein C0177_02340 [Fervidicoccus fontis]HEW64280.1 hypothetical protein [Fervidicoccus fontis]
MPIVYKCKNCGYVFHYLEHVGQDYIGIPSLNEIIGKYGSVCPKCGSKLSKPSQEDIVITSLSTAVKKNMLPVSVGGSLYVLSSILDTSVYKGELDKVKIPVEK